VAPCDEVESAASSAADASFSGYLNASSSAAADAAAADAAADVGSPPTTAAASVPASFAPRRRPMGVLAVRASLVRRQLARLARRNANVEPPINTRAGNDGPPDAEARLAERRDADALPRRAVEGVGLEGGATAPTRAASGGSCSASSRVACTHRPRARQGGGSVWEGCGRASVRARVRDVSHDACGTV
jgi:hypothetical protein